MIYHVILQVLQDSFQNLFMFMMSCQITIMPCQTKFSALYQVYLSLASKVILAAYLTYKHTQYLMSYPYFTIVKYLATQAMHTHTQTYYHNQV